MAFGYRIRICGGLSPSESDTYSSNARSVPYSKPSSKPRQFLAALFVAALLAWSGQIRPSRCRGRAAALSRAIALIIVALFATPAFAAEPIYVLIFLTPFWPPPNGPLPDFTSYADCAAAAAAAVYSNYCTYQIGGATTA